MRPNFSHLLAENMTKCCRCSPILVGKQIIRLAPNPNLLNVFFMLELIIASNQYLEYEKMGLVNITDGLLHWL